MPPQNAPLATNLDQPIVLRRLQQLGRARQGLGFGAFDVDFNQAFADQRALIFRFEFAGLRKTCGPRNGPA